MFFFCKENILLKDEYGPEEMTFAHEEEVFPTLNASDTSLEGENQGAKVKEAAKPEAKRKLPEKSTEKKVVSS